MAKNRTEILQEIREWNEMLSNSKNIPLNPNHTYKDENDVYERLTQHVKQWVEGVFGYYTAANGEFRQIPDGQEPEDCKEWQKNIGGKLTPLTRDWYNIAVTGTKENFFGDLPVINSRFFTTEEEVAKVKDDIRYEMNTAFFPVYRALKDSFSKRSWLQWIFNHKQYVAERDSLKVMENLMASMGDYTKKEIIAEYKTQKVSITERDIYPERFKSAVKEKPVEKSVEQPVVKAPEPETMLGKFEKLDGDEKGFYQTIVKDLGKAMHGVGIHMSARMSSIPRHIYLPLSEHAKYFCKQYDQDKQSGITDPEQFKNTMLRYAQDTAREMFLATFKALCKVDPATQNFVFGEMSLKDRIMVAQNVTDLMLNKLTPVGFDSKNLAQGAKGSYALDNPKEVYSFVSSEMPGKYTEAEINAAITAASKDLGALHRGQRAERPNVYEINYRPDPNDLKLEGKALTEALNLVNGKNPAIADPALKAIINENVRKFKAVQSEKAAVITGSMRDSREKGWRENDKSLAATYPDYDPKAMDKLISETVAQMNAKPIEKVAINLDEPKAQVVPPVESKPVEINAPTMKNN